MVTQRICEPLTVIHQLFSNNKRYSGVDILTVCNLLLLGMKAVRFSSIPTTKTPCLYCITSPIKTLFLSLRFLKVSQGLLQNRLLIAKKRETYFFLNLPIYMYSSCGENILCSKPCLADSSSKFKHTTLCASPSAVPYRYSPFV